MRILVVEDDRLLNNTLCYNLDTAGYVVDSALTKSAASNFLTKQDYDLIVLDVNLPDGNGFDFCREVKERRPDAAVIFLTANDMESDMKDSYEQRIQNQFGAFCVKVLKNEARHIQRDYASLLDQEKSLDELTASELEQTAVWDDYFMDEHVFEVLGLPVVVTGNVLADALAQLPEGKRDVILLSYFLGMTDREISEKLHIVHQTVSKRRLVTLKELYEYLVKEGFEWPDK